MGRIVYAEETLHTYLTSLGKYEGYTIGLILGQSAGQKDFAVHLAKTPPPLTKNVVEETLISSPASTQEESENTLDNCINSVQDIHESWVADHAKHVTRMLPGGMRVLGIFIVGVTDILNDNANIHKLKSVLLAIHKNLSWNKYLHGTNEEENLILCFNSVTQKCLSKSLATVKDGILKPTDWKFQTKATRWHQFETLIEFDKLFLIPADKHPETLKKQLQDILKTISDAIESALIAIEGEARTPDTSIESIARKIKDKKETKNDDEPATDKILEASLYIPCPKGVSSDIRITSCSASIRLIGQLVSRTFLHQKATVEEAAAAIKEDIVRSLASRLEMHWDSLIEEENGSPEENITLHEPPRRVLIELPQSKVTLSDYLFPGEGPQEALISLQELLDLKVQECNVQKDVELQVDPTEFYRQSEIDSTPVKNNIDPPGNHQFTVYIVGVSAAIVILVLAVLIHQFY